MHLEVDGVAEVARVAEAVLERAKEAVVGERTLVVDARVDLGPPCANMTLPPFPNG